MGSNTTLKAYRDSLRAYNNRHAIISAATPLELSKRDGIKEAIYAIKQGNSSVPAYYEDNRAQDEIFTMDVTVFVETTDTHTDRDYKYKLMLDMADELRGWAFGLDNSAINSNIYYTKYIGVINTIDDRPGFYAQTIRLEYNLNQQTQ